MQSKIFKACADPCLELLGEVQQCPICYLNYQSLSHFHCGHSCCQNCMSHWVQEIFNRQNLSSDTLVSCPNRCGTDIPYQELRQQIKDSALFNKIEQLYTLKYLRHTDDVIICPSSNCTYGGFIDRKTCKEPLKCEKCNHCWRDPSSFTWWENMTSKSEGEQWTNLKKVLFTVGCPSCGMFIYKDGGCQYMRCSKCNYEFCWFCQQSYKGYRHQNPWYMCPQRIWMLFCIYFLIFFCCNQKIGLYYPAMLSFQAELLYWLGVVIADWVSAGFGIFLPSVTLLQHAPWDRYSYRRYTWRVFLKRAAILAVAILIGLTLCWFASTFTQNMVWLLLHFAAVLLILGTCFFILFALYKFVKKILTSMKSVIYPLLGWKYQTAPAPTKVMLKERNPRPKIRKRK